MSSRVIIDPDGDILLQLHQEQPSEDNDSERTVDEQLDAQDLTVSSKVLSLASPVFKVIISGRFKESIELAEKKALSESYTLPLYGDDAEATIILCRILHFSTNGVPAKPTTVCLEKLAFLCDKYQCGNAIKYCGGLWLRDWLLVYDRQDPNIEDLCRLLIFAYVIDLPYEFAVISWKLFLYHKGPFQKPSMQAEVLVNHPLLRQDVTRELDIKRFRCCQIFYQGLMAPLNNTWKTLTKSCFCAAKTVGCHIKSLHSAKIMPQDLEFAEHTFYTLMEKASNLPYISSSQYVCSAYNCECRAESTDDLSSRLKTKVEFIRAQQKTFICLDCLKTDKRSEEEGKCRIFHS